MLVSGPLQLAASSLRTALLFMTAATLMTGCANCGDDEPNSTTNNLSEGGTGELLTNPGQVAFTRVAVGEQASKPLVIRNLSSNPLTIFEVQFRPGQGGDISALSLQGLPQTPFTLPGQGSQELNVAYAPTDTTQGRGEIVISSSDPDFTRTSPLVVKVETLANSPTLQASPTSVRFTKRATTAQAEKQILQLTNSGSAPLLIFEEPVYNGGQDFSINVPARTYPVVLQPYDQDKAAESPRDYELAIDVRYRSLGAGADSGDITIRSNDLSSPDPLDEEVGVTSIPVAASSDVPCILVDSLARNLGQVPVGKLITDVVRVENCGSQPLLLESVRIKENSNDDEYELSLGEWDLDGNGDVDQAIEILPGGFDLFAVDYTPTAEGTDQATIELFSNDPVTPVQEVVMLARGAVGACPQANAVGVVKGSGISGRPSVGAAPLDYIVLNGSSSTDEDGSLPLDEENWEWEVLSAPQDALVQLRDSDQAPGDPRYKEVRVLLTGEYEFGLKVTDNQGFESCNQAIVKVTAIPNEKLSIELTWTNPEDADETNNDGSDVDLHLTKLGPGKWFESPYDIYFRNPNSGPGSENSAIWGPESPSLDIDDVDGVGPETIQLNDPANCQWYGIGVHYYSQTFGTAFVTIRVYIDGKLAFEKLNKPMSRGGQFWDVGRIHWDSKQVLEVDELLPTAPQGQQPTVTTNMAESGLCTEAMLY